MKSPIETLLQAITDKQLADSRLQEIEKKFGIVVQATKTTTPKVQKKAVSKGKYKYLYTFWGKDAEIVEATSYTAKTGKKYPALNVRVNGEEKFLIGTWADKKGICHKWTHNKF